MPTAEQDLDRLPLTAPADNRSFGTKAALAVCLSAAIAAAGSGRESPPSDGWRVVRSLAAHRVLVVEVETGRPQQARAIALQLVEPQKDRYTEVMIYVYRPGRRGVGPNRRVQWTPRRGYVETIYEEPTKPRPSSPS
jgi:hypothetical protein